MILTTNTQALVNYSKAADAIIELIDDFGFTTGEAFDPQDFKSRIVLAMVSSSQSTPSEIITVDVVEEQEPTDEDLEQMLSELEEENRQEQLHANECPACGQLMR